MINVLQIAKEQFMNIRLILLMARYNAISKYQLHYLGTIWQFLIPAIQIGIYWFVFGIGIRGGSPVGETPYFIWLITGLIPWMFIGPTITQGANSVYSKVSLVSKMKFPLSVLPTVTIVGNLMNFIIALAVIQLVMIFKGFWPTIYFTQIIYYIGASIIFVFAASLFCSTLSTIARDFQNLLQSMIRMLFFLTPILWEVSRLPEELHNILKLNPIYYLISGFRNTLLGQGWFFDDIIYTTYFWLITLLILVIGARLHIKFRGKLVDYI